MVKPASVHDFPLRVAASVPSWVPRSDLRKLKQIDRWCEAAQAGLAALPGQSPAQHQVLRRIADELKAHVVAQWPAPTRA